MKQKELPGIRETTADFDGIEAQILKIFRREIYFPLLRLLSLPAKMENALPPRSALEKALLSGKLRYYRGRFYGERDAAVSRELKALGAAFDATTKSWGIPQSKLPFELRSAISTSEYRFDRVAEGIDRKLAEILPAAVAENVKIAHLFDKTLYRIDKTFEAQVKSITVVPKLTRETRAKVAEGYTKDLQKYIQDFSEKEILRLRKQVQEIALSGNRYETLKKSIMGSYGVSENKAKFLARQETALMMASFKQVRYQEAGIREYRWQCVVGSASHPVRPMHLALNGKTFSFDRPPVTDDKGNRNNPGQDYNCRCVARPIVKF